MSSISRREFFRRLRPEGPASASLESGRGAAPKELALGTVADFPLGADRRVHVEGYEVDVAADGEGLRALLHSEAGRRPLWLRIGRAGQVFALLGKDCPGSARLSLMTGEMMSFEEGRQNG